LIVNERFVLVGDSLRLDDELELFSNVKGRKFFPSGNQDLLIKSGGHLYTTILPMSKTL